MSKSRGWIAITQRIPTLKEARPLTPKDLIPNRGIIHLIHFRIRILQELITHRLPNIINSYLPLGGSLDKRKTIKTSI
jgi:hypothetical protein